MVGNATDLFVEHIRPWMGKKSIWNGSLLRLRSSRNKDLQRKANYGINKLTPVIQNVCSKALDQLSTKIIPNKKKKTDRKELDGGALYRRKPTITDKIAEGAAMFVNPTASWSGTL